MAKDLGASGVLFTDRREFNLNKDDSIALLYPNLNPFIAWLAELESMEVDDPTYKMFEDKSSWRYESISVNDASPSAWSDGAVTVAVDGAVGVTVDSSLIGLQVLIMNEAKTTVKGNAVVTAVSGANVTLKSLGLATHASETMSALADNDVLQVVDSNFGERSTSPDSTEDELRVVFNSAAISRTPVEISKTLEKAFLRGNTRQRQAASSELSRLRDVALKRHKMRKERKMLLSWRAGGIGGTAYGAGSGTDSFNDTHITDANGQKIRTTAGFIQIMLRYGRTSGDYQNVFTFAKASAKLADFEAATDKLGQYVAEPDASIPVFCGPTAFTYLTSSKLSKMSGVDLEQMQVPEQGFRFRYLHTGNGTLKLIPLPSLRRSGFDNYALIPNRNNIERKFFRPDTYNTNIKTDNGYDGIKDEYFSDDGLCLTQVDGHGLFKIV